MELNNAYLLWGILWALSNVYSTDVEKYWIYMRQVEHVMCNLQSLDLKF